jgi:hypothetical protein
VQALYRKASKWTPWAPKPDVLALLEARDHEGPVAGAHSHAKSPAACLHACMHACSSIETLKNDMPETQLLLPACINS